MSVGTPGYKSVDLLEGRALAPGILTLGKRSGVGEQLSMTQWRTGEWHQKLSSYVIRIAGPPIRLDVTYLEKLNIIQQWR